jgi:choline-glycine betaine transporter
MPIWVFVLLTVCGCVAVPAALRGMGEGIYHAARTMIVLAVIFIAVVWALSLGVRFDFLANYIP